ncbi:MAG: cation-translocating P-type ATPase [Oscillospiraceae bacterium]|nr:cation-translocating P-type ATPase [Oscillospiraceae bacterium]
MKVMKILKSDIISDFSKNYSPKKEGLSSKQGKEYLERFGKNKLKEKKIKNPIIIFGTQFKDILVVILLISTIISIYMGDYIEAITIAVIICVNAIIGFTQEIKTEKSINFVKTISYPKANVLRDGHFIKIPVEDIVIEDVFSVSAGDKVPADAVILNASTLMVDESVLTGESISSKKTVGNILDKDNSLNKSTILYSGTVVTKGRGTALVISTGMNSQIGQISSLINESKSHPTNLQKKLKEMSKIIAIVCISICLIVFVGGIIRGESISQMIILSLSTAVAGIPEGLQAIVTICLALSIKRMISKKAIIKKLHTVETLGCTTVICTDKTGTLTENKMTVKEIVSFDHSIQVIGDGHSKAGGFQIDKKDINISSFPIIKKLILSSVLCNNSEIYSHDKEIIGRNRAKNLAKGSFETNGDSTEISLLIMSAKALILKKNLSFLYKRIEEIPFDSSRKMMSVVISDKNNKHYLLTKGAFDIIIEKSSSILTDNGLINMGFKEKSFLNNKNNQLANNSLRVIAFAYKELAHNYDIKNIESNFIFIGMVGMIDNIRKETKKSINICQKAGVKIVMITGDHKNTAIAIGKKIGIYKKENTVITGEELKTISQYELDKKIKNTTIFARVSPEDKLKIIKTFKSQGEIVAMTGDGVNDAPAIKEADIGISMGINGTDVSKDAADMILIDDNFATITESLKEGRSIYQNIRKFIRYLIACNIGEVMAMFLCIIMNIPIILLPIHILFINLITDGLPAISLSLEPAEKNIMKKHPRKHLDSIFSSGLLSKIIFRGIFIGITTVATFISIYKISSDIDIARTSALLSLVISQLIHVFECKSEDKHIFNLPYLNNIKLIISVIFSLIIIFLIIYLPTLQFIFKTSPLDIKYIIIVLIYSLSTPIISSFISILSNHKKNKFSK